MLPIARREDRKMWQISLLEVGGRMRGWLPLGLLS
jgi:hypothetical protein